MDSSETCCCPYTSAGVSVAAPTPALPAPRGCASTTTAAGVSKCLADSSWQFITSDWLTIHDSSWQFMTVHDSSWQFMSVFSVVRLSSLVSSTTAEEGGAGPEDAETVWKGRCLSLEMNWHNTAAQTDDWFYISKIICSPRDWLKESTGLDRYQTFQSWGICHVIELF